MSFPRYAPLEPGHSLLARLGEKAFRNPILDATVPALLDMVAMIVATNTIVTHAYSTWRLILVVSLLLAAIVSLTLMFSYHRAVRDDFRHRLWDRMAQAEIHTWPNNRPYFTEEP